MTSPVEKRASAIPRWETIFRELVSQYFSTYLNSTLTLSELTHVRFARGSRLQWPTVFKLEGYVDPKSVRSMGFLGVKERIRKPINSKHTSLEALERHVIEYRRWFES